MSVVHAKSFAKDGSHPTWLEGYGAYGMTIVPGVPLAGLAWVEHDRAYAFCHVRRRVLLRVFVVREKADRLQTQHGRNVLAALLASLGVDEAPHVG